MCGCRGTVKKPSPRSFAAPRIAPAATRSLCASLEAEGNNTTVRIGTDGRLYVADLPVASVIPSNGCRGSFAQAVLTASTKLASVYLSPTSRTRIQAELPSANVKLGFLRDILRTF